MCTFASVSDDENRALFAGDAGANGGDGGGGGGGGGIFGWISGAFDRLWHSDVLMCTLRGLQVCWNNNNDNSSIDDDL